MKIDLTVSCEVSPKDLTKSCHDCVDTDYCTVGLFTCPWATTMKSCSEVTVENWNKFIRENLNINSLFKE